MPIDNLNTREPASSTGVKPAPAEGSANPANKPVVPSVEKKVVHLYEVKEGGEKKEVSFDQKLRESIVKTLRDRLSVIRSLQGEGRPLSATDTILLNHGEQTIRGMEQNKFSLQDISISRFVVYDDLIQRSLATAQIIQDNKFDLHPKLKKLPLLGKLFNKTAVDVQVAGRGQKFSTEYTRALHLETRSSEEIQNSLIELNSIRRGINKSLSVTDPLFDEDPPSTHSGGDRSKFHFAVLDQLDGPEGIMQQKFKGKSYAELWMENPDAATEALYEANQRAFTEFAREAGKTALQDQKLEIDTKVIGKHADEVEKKPSPEDISIVTKKAVEAQAAFTEAEAKFNELNNPVKDAEEALRQSNITVADLKAQYDLTLTDNTEGVKRLQTRIDYLISRSPIPDPSLSAEQKIYQQASIDANNRQITALEQDILKLNQEVRNSLIQRGNAERDLLRKTADHANKETQANANGLPALKTDYESKKTAKKLADEELKQKQTAKLGEVTPENKEKAKALRVWIAVHDKYLVIIDSAFNQPHDSEFTRERIARTLEINKQIEGAERIREQIFRQTSPFEYNAELARKMLPDETIAQAIIRTYSILPDDPAIAGKSGRDLLLATLPYVRNMQFRLGDLLRFAIHEGLKSAEKGDPYLTLSPYFAETQAELNPIMEDTASKEVGTAKIEDNAFTGEHVLTWEGDVLDVSNNQTHLKVTQNIQGSGITYDVSIRTDEKFFQALPEDIGPMIYLPTAVINLFYVNGHKRTDLATPIPEWISTGSGTENDDVFVGTTLTRAADKLLTIIENDYEQAPTMIRRATVNYVLSQNPAERLKILRGLRPNIEILVAGAKSLFVNLDNNGNFTIKTPTTDSAQELRAFERQLEQAGQQELLETIQSALGKEIILAQQRR